MNQLLSLAQYLGIDLDAAKHQPGRHDQQNHAGRRADPNP